MSHQVKSSNDVIFQHVCSMHQQHVFEEKKNVFQVLKEILLTKHKKTGFKRRRKKQSLHQNKHVTFDVNLASTIPMQFNGFFVLTF